MLEGEASRKHKEKVSEGKQGREAKRRSQLVKLGVEGGSRS